MRGKQLNKNTHFGVILLTRVLHVGAVEVDEEAVLGLALLLVLEQRRVLLLLQPKGLDRVALLLRHVRLRGAGARWGGVQGGGRGSDPRRWRRRRRVTRLRDVQDLQRWARLVCKSKEHHCH